VGRRDGPLGLGVLRHSWLDLDRIWALGLMLSGAAAIAVSAWGQ
jgi:hypothetical protein